jgi:hypothetical protein
LPTHVSYRFSLLAFATVFPFLLSFSLTTDYWRFSRIG